jgi:hypothetical protein
MIGEPPSGPPRSDAAWAQLIDAVGPDVSLGELEEQLDRTPSLSDDERAAVWLSVWSRRERARRQASSRAATFPWRRR